MASTHKKTEVQIPRPKAVKGGPRKADKPLDEALDDTFPASDPTTAQNPAVAGDTERDAQTHPPHRKEHKH